MTPSDRAKIRRALKRYGCNGFYAGKKYGIKGLRDAVKDSPKGFLCRTPGCSLCEAALLLTKIEGLPKLTRFAE